MHRGPFYRIACRSGSSVRRAPLAEVHTGLPPDILHFLTSDEASTSVKPSGWSGPRLARESGVPGLGRRAELRLGDPGRVRSRAPSTLPIVPRIDNIGQDSSAAPTLIPGDPVNGLFTGCLEGLRQPPRGCLTHAEGAPRGCPSARPHPAHDIPAHPPSPLRPQSRAARVHGPLSISSGTARATGGRGGRYSGGVHSGEPCRSAGWTSGGLVATYEGLDARAARRPRRRGRALGRSPARKGRAPTPAIRNRRESADLWPGVNEAQPFPDRMVGEGFDYGPRPQARDRPGAIRPDGKRLVRRRLRLDRPRNEVPVDAWARPVPPRIQRGCSLGRRRSRLTTRRR
jgi:hypothetical protein